jgi:hypothetical protein
MISLKQHSIYHWLYHDFLGHCYAKDNAERHKIRTTMMSRATKTEKWWIDELIFLNKDENVYMSHTEFKIINLQHYDEGRDCEENWGLSLCAICTNPLPLGSQDNGVGQWKKDKGIGQFSFLGDKQTEIFKEETRVKRFKKEKKTGWAKSERNV